MANKNNSKYTVVYVFGPTRCKSSYLSNEVLNRGNGEFVKIGKTDYIGDLKDCSIETLKDTAIKRCQQESKTGISDWCDIYDVFIFPQTKGRNVDNIIRNILCNDVYSLDNSKAESRNSKGDIMPGKEFVYGVSRNHIKHAVESYCFQLVIATEDNLEEIRTICRINAIMTNNNDEEDNSNEDEHSRKNRDTNMILSPGDIVYLIDSRDKNTPVCDVNNHQIQAIYTGDRKFSYNGESPKFASRLAIDLIHKFKNIYYPTISGNHCWQTDIESEGNKSKRVSLASLYDSMLSDD